MTDTIAALLDHKGRTVASVPSLTSVSVAVAAMNARRIGSLVILEAGRVVGIFTERDVLVRVVARGSDPIVTLLRDVMTLEPITVRSTTTVAQAMALVTERRCRHLPVVDDGELRGLISAGDLTSWVVRTQQRTIYDLEDFIRAA